MVHINDYGCDYDDMMYFDNDDRQVPTAPMTGMGCPPWHPAQHHQ